MPRTKSFLAVVLTVALVGLSDQVIPSANPYVCGQEIGFLESFALSNDREKALEELIPGTQAYYYYYSVHYQNTQQLGKVPSLIEAWVKRFGETEQVSQIRNRQALLEYSDDPAATLKYLSEHLNLNFDHEREIPAAQRDLPVKLPRDATSFEKLLPRVIDQHANTDSFTQRGLRRMATRSLTLTQRRHLLERISHPDFPNLVKLVADDLKAKDSRGFGSMKIHQSMTLSQLNELAQAYPKVKTQTAFVNTFLTKLAPSDDVDWRSNPDERRAYLDRMWEFVEPLPPSFNSLKASVLYRQLDFHLQRETYPRQKFMDYLKLPRNQSYVNPEFIKRARPTNTIANLNKNYQPQISFPAIGNDVQLVRDYLHHFLLEATHTRDFEPYLESSFLKREFATTKILNGVGDPEQWASHLTPETYQHLVERVDIEFSSLNPDQFRPDDDVELVLYTKNVSNLIIKVFEINTHNYYQKNSREIDTDINLDGLVPNFELSHDYQTAPAIRTRRSFSFPQLKNRGVFVVDFIAGGKSSRALIRKGRLQFSDHVTAAGHLFSVMDQYGTLADDASLWIGGARYFPNENGLILVPFSTTPGPVNAVITQGSFNCLQQFDHLSESYSLKAGLVVDRESLIRGNQSSVLVRPSLQVTDVRIPISLLEDPTLTIVSQNRDGVSSTKTVPNLELQDSRESSVDFLVPPRLKSLTFTLTGQIKNISTGQQQTVSASQSYTINEIEETEFIQDVHLIPAKEGYFLEALGKTGEIRPSQAVRVRLSTEHFRHQFSFNLRSDEHGLVDLGELAEVHSIEVQLAGGRTKSWKLHQQNQTYYRTIHAKTGTPIEIPAPAGIVELNRDDFSLTEVRNGQYVADRFESLDVKLGLVQVKDLEPGDYDLRMRFKHRSGSSVFQDIRIRVSEARRAQNVLIGERRHLETKNNRQLHITALSEDKDELQIQLHRSNANTRVHVLASRYQPAFSAFRELAQVGDSEPWLRYPARRTSAYLEGRKIGDEFEYILRRRYLKKFPGNMLTRPSILLNPWAIQSTENQAPHAEPGADFDESGTEDFRRRTKSRSAEIANTQLSDFSNLDFLDTNDVLLTNLKPDKDGRITIPRDQLGPRQHIRVLAVNDAQTIMRTVNLPLMTLQARDSRLTDSLDPEKSFVQSKKIDVLSEGDEIRVTESSSARFQHYDNLEDVFRLYKGLSQSPDLVKFEFILNWNTTELEEKQKLYSQFACHELNFFLLKKDPTFYKQVVVPHLRNKRDKTFLDRWLLKEDLSEFLQPWNYSRLNAVEQILLAQRLEDQSADIIRSLNEVYVLQPTDSSESLAIFEGSLGGIELESASAVFGRSKGKFDKKKALPKLAAIDHLGVPSNGGADDKPAASAPAPKPVFGSRGLEISGGRRMAGQSINGRQDLGLNRNRFFAGGELMIADEANESGSLGYEAMRGELRSRVVPVTRTRTEQRIRTLPDGSKETYLIEIPYTENVTQNYTVQVPQESNFRYYYENWDYAKLRQDSRSLYRRIPSTREWIENNYYQIRPDVQTAELVRMNRFWRDYANHSSGKFLSEHFAESKQTFTEMMFALAVLDLPFEQPEHKKEYVDNSLKFTAGGATIALSQQIRDSIVERGNTTILVSENFFQANDRYRFEDEVRFDKFVSESFSAHTLYGAQVVVTNPTSTPRTIEVLVQIPRGSVACQGAQETRTTRIDLGAFSTQTLEYHFYFPTAGKFEHFPAHVSANEKTLAIADGTAFNVKSDPVKTDESSWQYISQNGTNDEVIDFINEQNVRRIDLEKIAFRMKDQAFFDRAIATLRNRYVFNHLLWSYSVKHDRLQAISEFLRNTDAFVAACGPEFQSDLLTVDSIERNWYQHREYWPLVNARAHQIGPQRKILNPNFATQYQKLLSVLANRRTLDDNDHLTITYYMLLQDRIETALEHFAKVSRSQIAAQIQYDYCDAYLDIYREKPDAAAAKAGKWADYPVTHWRNRFKNILAQVDEIRGGATKVVDDSSQVQQQTHSASKSESFELEVANHQATIRYQNLTSVEVKYYEMDIELLFSRSPFALDNLEGFSLIRPNLTQRIQLKDPEQTSHQFDLPETLRNKNVLVEVVAGDQTRSQSSFANSLDIQLMENFGQLKVTDQETDEPMPKTYIKVYSRTADGQIRFHKDGYTDLRGRFDYVTQSNHTLNGIERYSLLIMSDENGAVMRQANPPKE